MAMDGDKLRLGAPVAVVLVLLGLAYTSSWSGHNAPSADKRTGMTKQTPQPASQSTPAPESSMGPTPMLRPLALLAGAIGPEPLYWLARPGEPMLSDSYLAAASAHAKDGCDPFTGSAQVIPEDPTSEFQRWRLHPYECALVTNVYAKAQSQRVTVDVIIATLPDWVDSNLQWTFDAMLDAIQTSAAQMDYVLSGFDLADTEPDAAEVRPKGSVWPYPRLHELIPGALLFRRTGPAGSTELLLVLLVGETATGGIHPSSLATALDLSLLWRHLAMAEPDGRTHPKVRVLGPTFSGSILSLGMAIRHADLRHALSARGGVIFDIVTGSATAPQNAELLEEHAHGLATFRATTRSDNDELVALARFLGRSSRRWQCGNGVALLAEANTTWGRTFYGEAKILNPNPQPARQCTTCEENPDRYYDSMANAEYARAEGATAPKEGVDTLNSRPLPCAIIVPFPLHISRLRTEFQQAQSAASANLPQKSTVALDLGETSAPDDRVPAETPKLTAATVEIMVSGMFRVIAERNISAVGILATDKRDHIYLAEQIARLRPNMLPFTVESSLMYLHPDVSGFARGTVIASTYALNERTQRLTRPSLARESPQQFGATNAQGVFNALAVLMNQPGQMIDYDFPKAPSEGNSGESSDNPCRSSSKGCTPPVWISVVGRGAIVPLMAYGALGCSVNGSALGDAQRRAQYAICLKGPGKEVTDKALRARQDEEARSFLESRSFLLIYAGALVIALLGVQIWAHPLIRQRTIQSDVRYSPSWWGTALRTWSGSLFRRPEGVPGHAAAIERAAACAALRGATITLLLWFLKLLFIFVANWRGLPISGFNIAFAAVAALAVIYLVWQVQVSFWFKMNAAHRLLPLRLAFWLFAIAVAAAVAIGDAEYPPGHHLLRDCGPIAAVCALIAVIADCKSVRTGAGLAMARPDSSVAFVMHWRRVPVLLGVASVIALYWDLAVNHWEPVEAVLYADRTAGFGNFVSPAVCIVLMCLAIYWWGIWDLRRVELLRLPETEVGIGPLLEQCSRQAAVNPDLQFRTPIPTVGGAVVVVTAAVAVIFMAGSSRVASIDGRQFSAFLLLGATCIAAITAHTLAHSFHLGRALTALLGSLVRHPAAPAFMSVGKAKFPWHVSFREPCFPDFEPLLQRIELASHLLRCAARDEPGLAEPLLSVISPLAEDSQHVVESLRRQHDGDIDERPLQEDEWRILDHLAKGFQAVLSETRWRTGFDASAVPQSLARAVEEMEHVVCFHAAVVLRDLITRLVSGFTTVFGALLLLVTTHLCYTFQGRVYWLSVDVFLFTVTTLVALSLLLVLERDTIMSNLWQTKPGSVSLVGGLTWRMIGYVAIFLATAFIVFFPELGGRLAGWLAPARTILQ
jgi:hypothetical protein